MTTTDEIQTVRTPGYTKRVKAVRKSIELMKEMQVRLPTAGPFAGTPGTSLERADVVELARFLLGLSEEQA